MNPFRCSAQYCLSQKAQSIHHFKFIFLIKIIKLSLISNCVRGPIYRARHSLTPGFPSHPISICRSCSQLSDLFIMYKTLSAERPSTITLRSASCHSSNGVSQSITPNKYTRKYECLWKLSYNKSLATISIGDSLLYCYVYLNRTHFLYAELPQHTESQ